MGVETFFLTVRNGGTFITMEEATQLREQWFDMWPEMKRYVEDLIVDCEVPEDYFDDKKGSEDDVDEENTVYDPLANIEKKTIKLYKAVNLVGIWRARAGKQMALNFPFQSLAAVISKRAAWLVYLDSLEFGYKLTDLIHDELLAEVDEDKAEEVAIRIQRLMLQAGKEIVPNVKMAAEFGLMRRWSKAAEAEYVDGRLVPYDDVHPYKIEDEAF